VIEFNARFGDPETEVVLPRLRSDIYDIFSAVADGRDLHTVSGFENGIQWSDEPTIGVVMASKGYPAHYEKGFEIKGLERFASAADAAGSAGVAGADAARMTGNVVLSGATDVAGAGNFDGVRVYHMGTSFSDGHYRTAGGRVLIVVASAPSLGEARDKAYRAVSQIDCPNLFYRKDIGHWALSGAGNG
jgi:phosphoribosylamine--glycine ligase